MARRPMTPTELALMARILVQRNNPSYGRHAPSRTPGRPICVAQLRARGGLPPWPEGARRA